MTETQKEEQEFGAITRVLAGHCRRCAICPAAAKRPNSVVERLMRWHRTWCPAWAAHTEVYGEKSLPGC